MFYLEPNTGRTLDTRRRGGTGTSRGNNTWKMKGPSIPHGRPRVKIIKKIGETLLDRRERQRRKLGGVRDHLMLGKCITREIIITEIDNALQLQLHVE